MWLVRQRTGQCRTLISRSKLGLGRKARLNPKHNFKTRQLGYSSQYDKQRYHLRTVVLVGCCIQHLFGYCFSTTAASRPLDAWHSKQITNHKPARKFWSFLRKFEHLDLPTGTSKQSHSPNCKYCTSCVSTSGTTKKPNGDYE